MSEICHSLRVLHHADRLAVLLISLLSIALLSSCAPESPKSVDKANADDYLAPELRTAVEALREDVTTRPVPDNAAELEARALVLYDWGNAYALAGNEVPPLLPSTCAQVIHAIREAERRNDRLLEQGAGRINNYVEQMSLRDDEPNALGTVVMVEEGPWPAGSWQTLRQRYTVGEKPMPAGASLILVPHRGSGISPQADNPEADDFTTAATDADAKLVPEQTEAGLAFRVTEGVLESGDQVTITYGDQSRGSRGVRMQQLSNDKVPMAFAVAFKPGGTVYTVSVVGFKVEGGEVARVQGFAPSILTPGEPFTLTVRSEDRHTNRATGDMPAYTVLLDGESFKELPAGAKAIHRIENISLSSPGVHRFTIESADGGVRGTANPIIVKENPEQRIYWGETHGHSGMAEGMGTSDAFFEFGRDDASLDFLVHSEHDLWMDDSEWEELRDNVQSFYEQGEFITYLGYEWTVPQTLGGHHNVVFRSAENRKRTPRQTHPTLSLLYKGLRENNADEDVLVIPHAHQAGDWRQSNPAVERLVEIQSYHGMFEWFGHMYLRKGHHVGFIAASDDHRAHPGYGVRSGLAAVRAPEKSRDAIFDAMRRLSTYAVTGDRIILELDVNGASHGERAPFAESRQISANVTGTAPIDMIVLKRNSTEIKRWDFRTLEDEPIGSDPTVEVAFNSSSATLYGMKDNPRGERRWSGTIHVDGAGLAGVEPPGFLSSEQDYEIDGNVVRFRTVTRGSTSRIMLRLKDADAATQIRLSLDAGVERPTNHTRFRGRVPIPAWEPVFRLGDLENGRARANQNIDGFADTVSVRHVREQAPMGQSVSFEDRSPRQGDYYTLRVEQANDSLAWSSPIWVGGFPPR